MFSIRKYVTIALCYAHNTRSCLRNLSLNIAWIVCRDASRHSTPASSRESTPRSKRKQSWSLKKSLLDSGSSLKAREAEMERLRSYQARVPSLDPDCTTEPSLSENDVSSSQTSGQLVCLLNKLLHTHSPSLCIHNQLASPPYN